MVRVSVLMPVYRTNEEYLREAEKNYCYIEVQLWNDDVINAYIE